MLYAVFWIYFLIYLPMQLGAPILVHFPLLLWYMTWVPRESPFLRSWFKKHIVDTRFPYKIEGASLSTPKQQQCIYAAYPHANVFAVSLTTVFGMSDESMHHIKAVVSSILYVGPIFKEFLGLGGCVKANKEDMLQALQNGYSLAMHPDGVRGITGLDPQRTLAGKGVIRREGFLKIALEHAQKSPHPLHLIPVWFKHEKDYYDTYILWGWFQRLMLTYCMYPWPMLTLGSPSSLWVFPKRLLSPSIVKVGAPILVEKDTQLADLSTTFYTALEQLQQ